MSTSKKSVPSSTFKVNTEAFLRDSAVAPKTSALCPQKIADTPISTLVKDIGGALSTLSVSIDALQANLSELNGRIYPILEEECGEDGAVGGHFASRPVACSLSGDLANIEQHVMLLTHRVSVLSAGVQDTTKRVQV